MNHYKLFKGNFQQILLILVLSIISKSVIISQSTATDVIKDSVQVDKSQLIVEPVPSAKIEQYRKDKDFIYKPVAVQDFSLMSYISYWIREFFQAAFGGVRIIWFLLVIAAITFIIFKIFKSDISGIFSLNKKNKTGNEFEYFNEDIHSTNLDKKLEQAISAHNYRDAIRYYYLKLLKQLDVNEIITWEISKTNADYQNELKNHRILKEYNILSGIYEYTWYGNFAVDYQHFIVWQDDFNAALQQINKK